MASRRPKDARITLRMPEDLKALIERVAEADHRTVTDWCNLHLENVARREAAKGKR